MTKLTNKEIIEICEDMRKKHLEIDWGFRVKQTKTQIRIYWGYLEYIEDENSHFTIENNEELGILIIKNENGTIINESLENDSNIKGAIQSVVYYMVSRY